MSRLILGSGLVFKNIVRVKVIFRLRMMFTRIYVCLREKKCLHLFIPLTMQRDS